MTVYQQLPKIGLFERLSEAVMRRLLMTGRREVIPPHTALNEVGEPCEGLGFVLSGQVRVDQMGALGWVSIATLEVGDVYGAMEWLEGKVWEDRLVTVDQCELLFVSTHALRPLSAAHPELQRQIERFTQRHTLHALLGQNDVFQYLKHPDLLRLIDVASVRSMRAGARLFDETVRISSLFVVGQGAVALRYQGKTLQTLQRGELLNVELALGADDPLLSAHAVSDVRLYLIPFDEVELAFARADSLEALQALARRRRASLL
jgi:CRP-like cAMP-binding protein